MPCASRDHRARRLRKNDAITHERNQFGTGHLCAATGDACLALPGLASCDQKKDETNEVAEVSEAAAELAPHGSYVTLGGTVAEASANQFVLDYGEGTIVVEMDDWDWYPEGHDLLENDQVVIYGYVDDDFYERRTIEASSVYVTDAGTQFYASGVDEEDFPVTTVSGRLDYDLFEDSELVASRVVTLQSSGTKESADAG